MTVRSGEKNEADRKKKPPYRCRSRPDYRSHVHPSFFPSLLLHFSSQDGWMALSGKRDIVFRRRRRRKKPDLHLRPQAFAVMRLQAIRVLSIIPLYLHPSVLPSSSFSRCRFSSFFFHSRLSPHLARPLGVPRQLPASSERQQTVLLTILHKQFYVSLFFFCFVFSFCSNLQIATTHRSEVNGTFGTFNASTSKLITKPFLISRFFMGFFFGRYGTFSKQSA